MRLLCSGVNYSIIELGCQDTGHGETYCTPLYNQRYNDSMVTTKVRKVGSSLGVILARPTIEALGVKDGNEVVISQARGRLTMRKLSPSSRPFVAAMTGVINKYRAVLARLDD